MFMGMSCDASKIDDLAVGYARSAGVGRDADAPGGRFGFALAANCKTSVV
jgi:hypothetical protein